MRTDLVVKCLDELGLSYDDDCVNYIANNWERNHKEELIEIDGFEIDEEYVAIDWLCYATEHKLI
jgi:hypothetical protein